MRIKNFGSSGIEQTMITPRDSGASRSSKTAGDQDTIQVSDEARLRSMALKTASEDDGVRADRVAQLKAQIADGTYKPDFKKTATNLVRDELDMFV